MLINNTETCSANLQGKIYVLFVVLNAASGLLAVMGNAVVLFVVYRTRALRTVSNYFICSLAVADFLVGLVINPLYIALVSLGVWVSNHPLYQAENYLWVHSLTTTTFSLAAISVDQYIAVTKVFLYERAMTEKRCCLIIGSVWSFSAIFASTTFCIAPSETPKLWIACVIVTVGIPLSVMIYCYYYIFREAKSQLQKMTANATRQMSEVSKNKKAAMTVAIIFGLFVCLFTPNLVFSVFNLSAKSSCQNATLYQNWLWAIWLALSSSACNPWVYAIRCRDYREAFKKICHQAVNASQFL